MLTRASIRSQRGLSLIELMVGITVGLIVTAGAAMVAVSQINEHRRLTLETQIQQDLRVAADLIQQDLRRAGFRGNAERGVWAPASNVGSLQETAVADSTPNAYRQLQVSDGAIDRVIAYAYAKTQPDGSFNTGASPLSNENFGVQWRKDKMELRLQLGYQADGSPNWQPITDPATIEIINFDVESLAQPDISLADFCDRSCVGLTTCPTLQVREIRFTIRGQAVHDRNVVRTLMGTERVRADKIDGACPT